MKDKIAIKSIIERYEWLLFSGLLFLALGIHICSTFGGLIWTSDSFHYWAASRSFQSEKVFFSLDGSSFIVWPPLFPMILSLFSESAYHVVHTLCFLSSFILIYLLFKKNYNKNIALISLAVFSLSVYPYLMSSFLWSETIFTLLLFSGLYFYQEWMSGNQKKYNLIISAILLSLMCLQRNAGVFIIIGLSSYWFIIFMKDKKLGFLIKMALLHILIVTPNILWNLYNKIYFTHHYNISNRPFFSDFIPSLETFALEFTKFFIPFNQNSSIAIILFIGTLIAITTLIQRSKYSFITLAYLLLFLFLPKFESSEIGRFLAPIFPIIILQLVLLSKEALSKFNSRKIKLVISFVLALLVLYNIARTTKNVKQWNYRSIHHPKSAKIFF